MRSLITVSAILSVSLLLACGDSNPSGPGETGPEWMPMAVGSSWTYDMQGTQASASDTLDISGWLSRSVMADTTHQLGFPVFALLEEHEYVLVLRSTGDTIMTSTDQDTLFLDLTDGSAVYYDDLTSPDCDTLLQLPLTVGDDWISRIYSSSQMIMEVTSLDAAVETPYGSYSDCAQIRETDAAQPDYYKYFFYADGVGDVFEHAHNEVGGLVLDQIWALSDYTP